RSQAKAVEVEGGTSVAWQCRPVAIDLGKKNLRRFRTVLWLQQERQGTREVRILNSDARDIPAMQVFNSVDCSRIDPPSAGGRNDHQHGPLEGPYPFYFLQGQPGSCIGGLRGIQADIYPDRVPDFLVEESLQLRNSRAGGNEFAPGPAKAGPV